MRAPVDHIPAPPFPPTAPWINVKRLRMDQQRGRPVLVEFWDFCRANSMRTLPYMRAWHERYADAGLRVVGVHASGFAPSADVEAVQAAVERLDIAYPVMVDVDYAYWRDYDNYGWPARYLWRPDGTLLHFHLGEGGYAETERAIRELLELDPDEPATVAPVRPEDAEGAVLVPQTADVEGTFAGPYEAGGVWAVLEGSGVATVNGDPVQVEHSGAYELIRHEVSTAGTLDLRLDGDLTCLATCFTPGLASEPPR